MELGWINVNPKVPTAKKILTLSSRKVGTDDLKLDTPFIHGIAGMYRSVLLQELVAYTSPLRRRNLKIQTSYTTLIKHNKRTFWQVNSGEGNSPVTCEFPAQRASTRKTVPFDSVIMLLNQ